MFGKLKEVASAAATDKLVEKILPFVNEHFSSALSLGAPLLKKDDTYNTHVIEPAYLATTAAAGGLTSLVPQFKDRFTQLFFVLRDELLLISEQEVALVPDFKDKLPAAIKSVLNG
ncbi:MAG TPA: hypothetical protein VFM46_11535 [Pseudomonadales bacterium]|nr:hypothetical protein [Pseudomonadales bacterium]